MSNDVSSLNAALAGRYAIDRVIGRGGMAVIYLAHDLRLGRDVALKVVRPEVTRAIGTERFLREIEVVAKLNHPHILPLYESGEVEGTPFFAMPYVAGESLRNRLDREGVLPFDEAIEIVTAVADALAHAHAQGIVHRDIKPENILFSAGHAVVADFGVARAVDVASDGDLTTTGTAVGTPTYMSPEQATGERIDGRSDTYALACVAYEILGGTPPFTGPPRAVVARHLADPVPPLSTLRDRLPEGIDAVFERALAKVPADRYATPVDFAAALAGGRADPRTNAGGRRALRPKAALVGVLPLVVLGWWFLGRAHAPRFERLAVLPFTNLAADTSREYVVAGVHEALIQELGRTGIAVTNRRSVSRYQDGSVTLDSIGRALGVEAVVEGTVAVDDERVRVSVELIDIGTEQTVWSGAYEEDLGDVLRLYRSVTRAIAGEIELALSPELEARLASSPRVDRETYGLYLRGMYHLNRGTPPDVRQGIAFLEEAVSRRPDDAHAWAGLALGYATIGHGPAPPPGTWDRARAAAERANNLDPEIAEAWVALADVKQYHDWDWEGAETAFEKADALNPGLAINHYHRAWYLALFDRLDEAIVEHERARDLDPFAPLNSAWLAQLLILAGRPQEAVDVARESIENTTSAAGWVTLGSAYLALGRFDEAVAAHEHAASLQPAWEGRLMTTYYTAGRLAEAEVIQHRFEAQPMTPWSGLHLARLYALQGRSDDAFRALTYAREHAFYPWIRTGTDFAPLRADPRFAELVQELGLPMPRVIGEVVAN